MPLIFRMTRQKPIYILGIESSCDDTSASVICNGQVLSNVVANQEIHAKYGGVVPELASRAHQQNIVPVIHQAIRDANIGKKDLGYKGNKLLKSYRRFPRWRRWRSVEDASRGGRRER